MNRRIGVFVGLTVMLASCGESGDDSPMPGMTAEEHARMQSGSVGTADSTGAVVRQAVHLTAQQERALGVVYTTVRRDSLVRTIRTVGHIDPPEPLIYDVAPKIDGFVEELFVASTGQSVREGQPLLRLYSPMLVSAQEELLTARRLATEIGVTAGEAWDHAVALVDAARRRLEYSDVTAEQIELLERTGQVTKTVTLVSPVSGVVLDKEVTMGQRVAAGSRLYRIADLSEVWVEGELFERDLQFVQVGSRAHIEVAAYPGEHLMGIVSFVHPTVDEPSRTNRVRVTVDNRDLRLKPGMFTTVYFDARIGQGVLTVPVDAVVVTGVRNLVFVRNVEGTLEPRDVVLGARAGALVEILEGLMEGEAIVASANFLVDAESRLAGTGEGMPGMQHGDHGTAIEPDTTAAGHIHD